MGHQKNKSIPININYNANPGMFIFANNINKITSFYLSMGSKIKNNKNKQTTKNNTNTNSATNYFTKSMNASNFILNNSKNLTNKNEKVFGSKEKKQVYTLTNSIIRNNLFISGFRTSKNCSNNCKIKNKLNNASISHNKILKIQQNYTSRARYLDSRNRTKKKGVKSRLQRYTNNKPVSVSFSNFNITKRQFRDNFKKNINNYIKRDLCYQIDSRYENKYSKIHKKMNLYEIKNRHFRYNTTSFGSKDIENIFHKKTLSKPNIYNINNLAGNTINNINNININNNIYINNDKNININQIKTSANKAIINKEEIKLCKKNVIKKINYNIKSKEKLKRFSKGKINGPKINISEKKLKLRENKSNKNSNNICNNSNSNNNNQKEYNFKKNYLNSLNIPGLEKISGHNKKNYNKIPIPKKKLKNVSPTQRNVKINLAKILKDIKIHKNIVGRKDISTKKDSKENKSELIKKVNNKIKNINKIKENHINNKIIDKNNNNYKNDNKIIKRLEKNNRNNKENNKNYSNILTGKTDSNYSIDNIGEPINLNFGQNNNENKDTSHTKLISNLSIYNDEDKQISDDNIYNHNEEEKKESEMDYKIINDLFNEENLDDLPEDNDEEFNDLYSVINKINFGRVLVGIEGFFSCEGNKYKKYKDKFNNYFNKLYDKEKIGDLNSNIKQKNILALPGISSNKKTNYSSSKKCIVNNNIEIVNNDLKVDGNNY